MADEFGTVESGVEQAIKDIGEKKEELQNQADKIAAAFTEVTATVQLDWLNNMISMSWNTTGINIVSGAKRTMEELMTKLNDAKETAGQVSTL